MPDAASQSPMWGYATDGPSDALVAVGATTTVTDSTLLYEGAGTRLLVKIDFGDVVAATAAPAAREHCATSAARRAVERDAAR